jgi:hypothetical protein
MIKGTMIRDVKCKVTKIPTSPALQCGEQVVRCHVCSIATQCQVKGTLQL